MEIKLSRVLELVNQNKSRKEIAKELNISPVTLDKNILKRFNIKFKASRPAKVTIINDIGYTDVTLKTEVNQVAQALQETAH